MLKQIINIITTSCWFLKNLEIISNEILDDTSSPTTSPNQEEVLNQLSQQLQLQLQLVSVRRTTPTRPAAPSVQRTSISEGQTPVN